MPFECVHPAALANALFDCEAGDRSREYVVLGFKSTNLDAASDRWCQELRRVRASLPAQPRPKLYWRTAPAIERYETFWAVRSRLAIPGVDWSQFTTKPEGHPFPQVK